MILLTALLACTGDPRSGDPHSGEELQVFVSILPQAFLVQRLGGDQVTVEVLVGPGSSPATFEPTPKQMAALGRADLFIRIGVPFEKALLAKVAAQMPGLPIVDGRQGIELQAMAGGQLGGVETHDHGEDHDHDQDRSGGHPHRPGEADPHFWLDPQLVKIHVVTIAEALGRHRQDASFLEQLQFNRDALLIELDAVDARIAARLAGLAGRDLFVNHPAYGYFARRYGLRQVAVEVEGKEPSARQLALLIERARQSAAAAVFVQPQVSDRSARVVAEAIDAEVLPLDPLAPDYLANLERMAECISGAYR